MKNPSDRNIITPDSDVIASICCLTYNHGNFIRQALDSFLMQQTNFAFEILIHDDASTDNTQQIIKEYQILYPDVVKPIFQIENQRSKLGGGMNPRFNYPRASGKYIALCEGDDYWTDPFKLQKQIDFLEANPEYVVTGHDAVIINEKGEQIKNSKLPELYKCNADSETLKRGFWILTLSMVFRNVPLLKNYPNEAYLAKNGDTFLISMLGQYGNYKYIPEIEPAVYRVHGGGVWSAEDPLKKVFQQKETQIALQKYYRRINDKKTSDSIKKNIFEKVNQNLFEIASKNQNFRLMFEYYFKTAFYLMATFQFKLIINNTKTIVKSLVPNFK